MLSDLGIGPGEGLPSTAGEQLAPGGDQASWDGVWGPHCRESPAPALSTQRGLTAREGCLQPWVSD